MTVYLPNSDPSTSSFTPPIRTVPPHTLRRQRDEAIQRAEEAEQRIDALLYRAAQAEDELDRLRCTIRQALRESENILC
jgi:hypothetical protein